jgi:hypothetical protein
MDEYSKNRNKFNTKFKRITKKEYDSLTPLQKRQYDAIKERKNIPAIYTGGSGIIKVERGLAEFDSDTFERVKKPMIKRKEFNEKQERAAKFRNYDTDLGFPLPKPARKTAPSENKAKGGLAKSRTGPADYRKGGMVLATMDKRKKK